jgi:hypothetical protein
VKQPDNDHSKFFGNDESIHNDAEIIVYYEYKGPAEPVLKIPFWFCKSEGGDFSSFEQSVRKTAKALAEAYTHWPEGYIHIQTIINEEYVNMV